MLSCLWDDDYSDAYNYVLNTFSFQPVLHDWCNRGCGKCYPVCGMMTIVTPTTIDLILSRSSQSSTTGITKAMVCL